METHEINCGHMVNSRKYANFCHIDSTNTTFCRLQCALSPGTTAVDSTIKALKFSKLSYTVIFLQAITYFLQPRQFTYRPYSICNKFQCDQFPHMLCSDKHRSYKVTSSESLRSTVYLMQLKGRPYAFRSTRSQVIN